MNYDVTTKPRMDGTIEMMIDAIVPNLNSTGYWSATDVVRENIMRQIINTRDAQTKAALIALGWTPPHSERRSPAREMYKYSTSADARIRALERRRVPNKVPNQI